MNAALCRWIDRASLEFAAARMPPPDGREAHLEEARQLLDSAVFAAEPAPAEPVFEGKTVFHFDTPRPTPWPNNNLVWGRFYPAAENWRDCPAMLLLHGWNDAINHFLRFPSIARKLNRAGINAVILTAPYHFRRWPKGAGAWGNFLCPDLLRTAEAAVQAVTENRMTAAWLLGQGCPMVGVWGVSMGGWLAGLTARYDARISCAVLVVPVTRLDRLVEEAPFCRGIREALKGGRLGGEKFNLTNNPPPLPPDKILLVSANYDLFVPPDTINELWESWGRPEIWRLPHGHISVLAAPGLAARTVRWLSSRLRAPGAK